MLLFFIQNIHCGYSCTHNVCFDQKYLKKIPMKFSTLSAEKIICILHGHVVVMITSSPTERRQFAVAIPKNTSRYGMLGDGWS